MNSDDHPIFEAIEIMDESGFPIGKYTGDKMKPEIKVAIVLDDYKVKNKEEWWKKSLQTQPHIEKHYQFVREESVPSVTKNTSTFVRYYRLKDGNEPV